MNSQTEAQRIQVVESQVAAQLLIQAKKLERRAKDKQRRESERASRMVARRAQARTDLMEESPTAAAVILSAEAAGSSVTVDYMRYAPKPLKEILR